MVVLVAQSAIGVPSTVSGKGVEAVKIVRNDGTIKMTDDSTGGDLVTLPGARTSMTVPDGQQAILLVHFSAPSACWGGVIDNTNACYIRILVNGVEEAPASAGWPFDSTESATSQNYFFESHSFDRATDPLGPGTYVVKARARVDTSQSSQAGLSLSGYVMTVERVRT
jgi:hypothetical protein